jgi:hypothetical protein
MRDARLSSRILAQPLSLSHPPDSDERMAQLVRECGPLVAAGKASRSQAVAAKGVCGAQQGSTSTAAAAFSSSLHADSVALSALASHMASPATVAAIDALVAGCCRSRTSLSASTGHSVFTSGLGKSGAPASRLAASLRSIGVRASFIHGSEWVHGDLGGCRSGDIAVLFSHSGRTPELVDAASKLRQVCS